MRYLSVVVGVICVFAVAGGAAEDPKVAGATGVHWHVNPENEVCYASVDDEREEMIRVEVKQRDGSFRRCVNTRFTSSEASAGSELVMVCVDCHNRATHIYQEPEFAVDERIRLGGIDRSLPDIRRQAVAAVTGGYSSPEAARQAIRTSLESYSRRNHPQQASSWYDRIDAVVEELVAIWARNVHPGMRTEWGAYPSFLGHTDTPA
jgi:hypothetical protein